MNLLLRTRQVWYTFQAALSEIFDESAYERFLVQRGLHSSVAAYQAFRGEHELRKSQRPRCC